MQSSKPVVYFVLGGPGSGKGTLCAELVEKDKFVHLSAGDLLRKEVPQTQYFTLQRGKNNENAKLIQDKIAAGEIVPVAITVRLLKEAMKEEGWEVNF